MQAPALILTLTAHVSSWLMGRAAVVPSHSTMLYCLQRCVSTLLDACSNDAFDAETGVDKSKAESVVNLTGNRKAVLAVANGFLLAGGLFLHNATKLAVGLTTELRELIQHLWLQDTTAECTLVFLQCMSRSCEVCSRPDLQPRVTGLQGDAHVGLALALAVFMGYLYQGPPFR